MAERIWSVQFEPFEVGRGDPIHYQPRRAPSEGVGPRGVLVAVEEAWYRIQRTLYLGMRISYAPSGLDWFWVGYPRLKPWAIILCPYGAKGRAVSLLSLA